MIFYLLCLILFLLPSYLIRFKIFNLIPTNFLEILIILVFIILLFNKVKNQSLKKWIKTIILSLYKEKIFFFGSIFIFAGIFFSSTLAQDQTVAFGIFKGWFLIPFIFFLTLYDYLKDFPEKEKNKKIKVLLNSLALSGLIYLVAFAFTPVFKKIYNIKIDFITFDDRLKIFFDSPNQLAMALAPVLLVFFHLLQEEKNIVKKMAYFNLIFVFIIFFLLTKSLGAIVAVFGALFFYTIFSFQNNLFLKFFSLVESKMNASAKLNSYKKYQFYILSFCLVISIIAPLIFTFFYPQPSLQDRSSFASRIMIWQSTRAILADNLIFGVGPGNFQNQYLNYQKKFPPYLEWAVPHPHNTFLTFWISGGILALIGFLFLMFWIIKNISPTFNSSFSISNFQKTPYLVLYTLYFIIHSSIDTLYFKNDLSVLFWFSVSLIMLQKFVNQSSIESKVLKQNIKK